MSKHGITNTKVSRLLSIVTVVLAATILVSCGHRSNNSEEEYVDVDLDYEDLLDASEEMHGSICFEPYPEPEEWIAANLYELLSSDTTSLSVDVNFGPDSGIATLSLEAYKDSTFHAVFTRDGKKIELLDIVDPEHTAGIDMATLAAIDLDKDGNKELILHDGVPFNTYVFAVCNGKNPVTLAGDIPSNFGFFVTDNGTIVSLFGSQGGAYLARYENQKLTITDDDAWFDKALMASPRFHNLEYYFEDTSEEDNKVKPLLKTEKYIVCYASALYGNHCLRVDLDQDGEEEQLYMSNPGWGANIYDIARVCEKYTSYGMTYEIIENHDTIAMDIKDFDANFRGTVQLSAVDVNADGILEVILSAGEAKLNSTYIYSYKKGEGIELIKHIEHKGILKESDLQ